MAYFYANFFKLLIVSLVVIIYLIYQKSSHETFGLRIDCLRRIKKKRKTKLSPFVSAFQAYISCVLGVHRVGYVMICFGVVNAGCSLLFGSLMKFVGRQPLMALGAIVHASLIVVLLMWKPHPENPYVFFSVSGLWGVGDAVWQTQVNGECLSHFTF